MYQVAEVNSYLSKKKTQLIMSIFVTDLVLSGFFYFILLFAGLIAHSNGLHFDIIISI